MRKLFVMPSRSVNTPEFQIDHFEVTNEHFWQFVWKQEYIPSQPTDFLKHWGEKKAPPEWSLTFPVVWVSQEDAQAFCEWRGGKTANSRGVGKGSQRNQGSGAFPGATDASETTANFGNKQAEATGNRPR